ncbi:transposase, partial [Brytella acorum]
PSICSKRRSKATKEPSINTPKAQNQNQGTSINGSSIPPDDRTEAGHLAAAIQEVTDESVDLAYVDQGYTGSKPDEAARPHGIALEIVKLPQAKRGFVLLPRRWVVERSFAWATRCRRLVKDYERYASTLASLHVVAFACFMLRKASILAHGA